jgi:hypothetical protein
MAGVASLTSSKSSQPGAGAAAIASAARRPIAGARASRYQCTPRVSVAIAICSKEARSSVSTLPWPLEAAESGNTR